MSTERPRIASLTLDGWKGATGTLDLSGPPVTLLVGPTGSGKSGLIQATQYAMGAGVPGFGTPKQPGKIAPLVGPGDKATVILAADTAAGHLTVHKTLQRVGADNARQTTRCSAGPIDSDRSEDHEAAARERLGNCPAMFNLAALTDQPEDALKTEILRLCGGLRHAGITRDTVLDRLEREAPAAVEAFNVPEGFDALADPLEVLAAIGTAAKEQEKEAERLRKEANATARAAVPEPPDRNAIAPLKATLIAAQARANGARERKGALDEARKDARAKAETRATLTTEIAALEERLAALTPEAPPENPRLATLRTEAAGIDPVALEATLAQANVAVATAKAAFDPAKTAADRLSGQVAALRDQLKDLGEADACPLCETTGKALLAARKTLQTRLATLGEESATASKSLIAARSALTETTTAAASADQALTRARRRFDEIAAETRKLTAADAETRQKWATAQATATTALAEKRARLADLPPALADDATAATAYQAILAEIREAEQAERAADAAVTAWNDADRAANDALIARDRAKEETAQHRLRRDRMQELQAKALEVEADALKEAVAPLTRLVNEQSPPDMGTFVIDLGGGGCKLGLIRDRANGTSYMVPWSALSGGESLVLGICFLVAYLQLEAPPFRLGLLDSINDLDPDIQGGLVRGSVEAIEAGLLDQAILAGHCVPAHIDDLIASGAVRVVDLRTLDMGRGTPALAAPEERKQLAAAA